MEKGPRAVQLLCRVFLTLLVFCLAHPAHSADFYEGKTIKIIVGTGAGGGYDAYGRLLSRYMRKYVPRTPVMVVQNMPGASGLGAANYIYNVAAPDGLTFGAVQRQVAFAPLFANTAARYEAEKFTWLGTSSSFMNDASFLLVRKSLGIKSVDDIRRMERPLQLGVGGRTSVGYEGARVISSVLGLNIRIIIG